MHDTLFARRPQGRVWGSVQTATEPYLRLSGTSMASPVVAGTVALMLQANPALTPAEVKAVLQASAEKKSRFDATAQGAGFLDARAAVEMSQRFAESPAPARLDALVRRLESASAEWERVCRETVNAACEAAAGNVVWYILRHPKLWWQLRDLRTPSWGERNVDMVERVQAVVDAVRAEFAGGQVVLVSHQAPIWVARLAFEHRRLSHWPGWRRCTLASVTTLTFDGDRLTGVGYAEPAAAALLGPAPTPGPGGGPRPGPDEGLRPEREAR